MESYDEPLTIRQTEEHTASTGRSYTEFLKSLFTSSGTTSTTGVNVSTSAGGVSSLSPIVPQEKLTELDVKSVKGNSHLCQTNKRCKSLWKNVEPQSSTILEDEKLNSFLLERAWQLLQKKSYLKN